MSTMDNVAGALDTRHYARTIEKQTETTIRYHIKLAENGEGELDCLLRRHALGLLVNGGPKRNERCRRPRHQGKVLA
jgi:hypothetical protein